MSSSVNIELTAVPKNEENGNNQQCQAGSTTSVNMDEVPEYSDQGPYANRFGGKLFRNQIRLGLIKAMQLRGEDTNLLYNMENGTILPEYIDEECQNLNSKEKNIAFLWSCFVSRGDLSEPLDRIGANLRSIVPGKRFTALHLAAFSGCVTTCEWLISNGLQPNLVVKCLSPLRCAILGNSLNCIKLLLRYAKQKRSKIIKFSIQVNAATDCVEYLIGTYVTEDFEDHFKDDMSKIQIRVRLINDMKAMGGGVNCLYTIENSKIPAEHIVEKCRSLNFTEKNLVFLWSCFVKRDDLLEPLFQIGANLRTTLPDNGFTALHLAAFSGCVKSCEWLISNWLDLNLVVEGLSPLHCAVFGNSLDCTKLLLKRGATLHNTILHCAVKANATECLECLLNKKAYVNEVDEMGWTALHVAAARGMVQCLQIIMWHCPKAYLEIQAGEEKYTPLHFASAYGHFECCKLLIDGGADGNAINGDGETALHLAAEANSSDCVELLLNAGCKIDAQDKEEDTPLHKAVVGRFKIPGLDALENLLKRGADVNLSDYDGTTPLHTAANKHVWIRGSVQCVDLLIMSGADVTPRDFTGYSPLGLIARNFPGSIKTICRQLDSCVSVFDHEKSHRKVELKFDFRYILQNYSVGEMVFLRTLTLEGQGHLIEHPMCKAFLYLKWQGIRKIYYCHLFWYFCFLTLLTAYMIFALAHECYNAAILTEACEICLSNFTVFNDVTEAREMCFNNFSNFHKVPNNISAEALKMCQNNFAVVNDVAEIISTQAYQIQLNNSTMCTFLIGRPLIIDTIWYLLALMAFFEGVRKIMSIPGEKSIKYHCCKIINVTEWFIILSVFLVSHNWYGWTFDWQRDVGSLAVLFAWTDFMIMVGQLPIFGIYVSMFTRVQTEFFKVLTAYSCLLIGFTTCFCVIFPSNGAFQNPFIGFIKTLVMMTGELDFATLEKNLKANTSPVFSFFPYIAYTLFIIFVAVVLMNLLVGIAVNDIKVLHKTAGLTKLIRRINLIYSLELAVRRIYLPEKIVQLLLDSISPQEEVLSVEPLVPDEESLPQEIMMAALNLARKRKTWADTACCWSDTLKNTADSVFNRDEKNLNEDIQQLRELVQAQIEADKNLYKEFQQLKEMNRAQNALISELVKNSCNNSLEDRLVEAGKTDKSNFGRSTK